jgi:hypothetical protein
MKTLLLALLIGVALTVLFFGWYIVTFNRLLRDVETEGTDLILGLGDEDALRTPEPEVEVLGSSPRAEPAEPELVLAAE